MIHASLFSGIGGSELAASWMGWENAFHCEINPFGRQVLDYWYPESESYEDITKTDFTKWGGRIDVLTGGFPCQPFSVAGKRRGQDDDRYLWPQMLRVIREVRPTWVVGENVAGIVTMVQPGEEVKMGNQASIFGEDDRERVLIEQEYVTETICRDLEREGYSVQPFVIPACAVGAPHRRDRIWFVANRIQGVADNSYCSADVRIAREHGEAQGEERLQERDEIRESYESGSIRESDTDTHRSGLQTERPEQPATRTSGSGLQWDASNSDSERLTGRLTGDNRREDTARIQRDTEGLSGDKPIITDSGCDRQEWGLNEERPEQAVQRQPERHDSRNGPRIQSITSWAQFPAQSPVCGGDDGLSHRLVGIAFPRWREESVKACGNAIVPNVIYEIFKSIDSLSSNIKS